MISTPGATSAKASASASAAENQDQFQPQTTRIQHDHDPTIPKPIFGRAPGLNATVPTARPRVRITNEAGEEVKLPSRPSRGRGRDRSALNPEAPPYQGMMASTTTITPTTPALQQQQQQQQHVSPRSPTIPNADHDPLSLAAQTADEPPSSIACLVQSPPLRSLGFAACAAFLKRALSQHSASWAIEPCSPVPVVVVPPSPWSDVRATVVLFAAALHRAFPPCTTTTTTNNNNNNNNNNNDNDNDIALIPGHEVFPDYAAAGEAVRVRADLREWVVGVVEMVDAVRRANRAARLLWEAVPDRCTPDGVPIPN
ncbi:hypothetical protein F5X96DRAFT_378186 [Biscogniauxia mediterranea]|nr:hypothetical protein F5X96DRAFT_378186 [Biscogniauxia mediterranea]